MLNTLIEPLLIIVIALLLLVEALLIWLLDCTDSAANWLMDKLEALQEVERKSYENRKEKV